MWFTGKVVCAKELCKNNRCSMRRMNPSGQGGGVRHSGAMPNDDNVAMADSDKHNVVIICAQFLNSTAVSVTKVGGRSSSVKIRSFRRGNAKPNESSNECDRHNRH